MEKDFKLAKVYFRYPNEETSRLGFMAYKDDASLWLELDKKKFIVASAFDWDECIDEQSKDSKVKLMYINTQYIISVVPQED